MTAIPPIAEVNSELELAGLPLFLRKHVGWVESLAKPISAIDCNQWVPRRLSSGRRLRPSYALSLWSGLH